MVELSQLADKKLSEIDWLNDKETLHAWNTLHAPKSFATALKLRGLGNSI